MQLIDLLTPERVQVNVVAHSKKRLLERMAAMLAGSDADERAVYSSLCARERLGSTALGKGVAIPHGRMGEVQAATGAFIRLREPVPFEAPDQAPVDLFFGLVVPENCSEEHLRLLAQLAELFSSEDSREGLRAAETGDAVLDMLSNWHSERAAG